MPHPTVAQEGLRNAIEGDRAYSARQSPESRLPDSAMKLGPVLIQASLNYALEWNDNIRNTETDQKSDFIHRPEFNFRGEWAAIKDSRLTFGMGIGYQKYMDADSLDRFTITPNSELAWDIHLKDFQVTLYDRVSRSQDVTSQGGLSGVAEFPRTENTLGFRTTWQPSSFRYEWGYSHYNFISDSPASGSTSFNYLNRSAEQFFARAAYQLAAITHLGIEGSGALTDYESVIQRDNQNVSIGPFVEWQIRPSIRLTLRGGYVTYFQDGSSVVTNTSQLHSYYAAADLKQELTAHFNHLVSFRREISQGINEGGGLSESLTLNYSANWAFLNRATLTFDGLYQSGKEPRSGAVDEYDRFIAGGGVRWQVTRHLTTTAAYHYSNRDSVLPGLDYAVNTVILAANYQF